MALRLSDGTAAIWWHCGYLMDRGYLMRPRLSLESPTASGVTSSVAPD